MTNFLEKEIGTSRKILLKHNKFYIQIDANDELSCWTHICIYSYKDRLGEEIKTLVHVYWVKNSHVSPKAIDVL